MSGRFAASLEILSAPARSREGRPPLLFVHGAFVGAWCWAEHFLPWFAQRGWDAHAVSLRGHGASAGRDALDASGLQDYVEDVVEAASGLGEPPVLIGHSMGGIVVQRAAHRCNAPALVLMAPVPPHGLGSSVLWLALRDPPLFFALHATQLGMGVRALGRMRDYLFSASLTEADIAPYMRRAQHESNRALAELMWPQHVWITSSVGRPVRVLGAGNDALLSPAGVYEAAAFYGVAPTIVPGMAHAMMLEPGWLEPAERIARWLEETL